MDPAGIVASSGVFLILVAFVFNLRGWMERTSALYLWLNFVGAVLACISSIVIRFWPFVVMEAVWAVAALGGIIRSDGERAA